MNTDSHMTINTLSVFEHLIQPASQKEQQVMLDSLLSSGSPAVIHTWNGNHLNDEMLYQLCLNSGFEYRIIDEHYRNMVSAAMAVCRYQLQQRELTVEYRRYLIGQIYICSYTEACETSREKNKRRLAETIGREFFLSAAAIQKYELYAEAVNTLFEKSEGFIRKILMGQPRVPHDALIALSHLTAEEISSIEKSASSEIMDHLSISYIRNETRISHLSQHVMPSHREHGEPRHPTDGLIRQMPAYNPDSEANSLCMTIDSWISSINRVKNSESFPKMTNKASLQLMKQLSFLEHTINSIQESLVERTSI